MKVNEVTSQNFTNQKVINEGARVEVKLPGPVLVYSWTPVFARDCRPYCDARHLPKREVGPSGRGLEGRVWYSERFIKWSSEKVCTLVRMVR